MKKIVSMMLLGGSLCLGGVAMADDAAPAAAGDTAKPDATKKPAKTGKHKKPKKDDKKADAAAPAPDAK